MKSTWLTTTAIIASAILLGSAIIFNPSSRAAYAHTFKGNENVSFLSMVQQIKTETSLAGNDTSDKAVADHHIEFASKTLSNSTLKEIAERNQRLATDIPTNIQQLKAMINSANATADDINSQVQQISGLLDEAVQVRIDPTQEKNSTVQALVVADLVNKALEHYGEAVGFQGNMTDMSAMASMSGGGGNSSSSNMKMNISGNNGMQMSMSGGNSSMKMAAATKVLSQADYQSALALAQKAQDIYQQQIKTKALPGKENAVKTLDSAFPAFVKAIKDKSSAMDVMTVAHLKVHPNLMEAYGLTVVG